MFVFSKYYLSYLGAGLPLICWMRMVELVPHCPSPLGGTRDTGGPDRAGTAAAEEQLLVWTEGKEGGVQTLRVAVEGEHEPES